MSSVSKISLKSDSGIALAHAPVSIKERLLILALKFNGTYHIVFPSNGITTAKLSPLWPDACMFWIISSSCSIGTEDFTVVVLNTEQTLASSSDSCKKTDRNSFHFGTVFPHFDGFWLIPEHQEYHYGSLQKKSEKIVNIITLYI